MAPVLVRRWEDSDGLGPYESGADCASELFMHSLPGATADCGCFSYEFFCGFAPSNWFKWRHKNDVRKLKKAGLVFNYYLVPPGPDAVKFGDEQVVFRKDFSLRLETWIPPTPLSSDF